MKIRLTQSYVASINPNPDKPLWITDVATKNLKLYVGTSGVKVWYLYYRDADNKKASQKLGSFDALTVAQARDMARDFIGRIVRGESLKKEKAVAKLTYSGFLRDFYEPWVIAHRKSGKETLQSINAAFSFLMPKALDDLSIMQVEQWRTKRMNEGKKAATINRLVVALKASINWGVKRGIIQDNPLARLERLQEHDSDSKVRFLSDDERERLMIALDSREKKLSVARKSHNDWLQKRGQALMPELTVGFADYLKPMVIISLNSGIRRGTLFALKWEDVDFSTRNLTLRAAAMKSGKTTRLPINSVVVETFAAWREQNGNTRSDALIFPSPVSGEVMNNVKKSWAAVLKDAQIENFRWHDMRHDFASRLVMQGVDLNVVRELLGHADMKMTMRYAHLAPSIKIQAVELLAKKHSQ